MRKKQSIPLIPPLSVKQAHELEAIEMGLERALENCMDPYGRIANELKATTYLCSYAVKIFDFYTTAYLRFPHFKSWVPELKVNSIRWALNCLSGYRGTTQRILEAYLDKIAEALDEHLKHLKTSHEYSLNPLLRQLGEMLSAVAPAIEQMNADSVPPKSEGIGPQIRDLMNEARLTKEALAEGIGIQERNVYRHLTGTPPRAKNIAAYEEFFSRKLKRIVRLKTS